MEATKMRVKNKYFSITPNVVEKMIEADINPDILRQRLASRWKFEDAIEAPLGVRRSEWDSLKPKDGKTVRKDTTKNDLGHTLADYVDVQIDACNELDIPVYDDRQCHGTT